MLRTKEKLEELFAESRKRAEKKKEQLKLEKNKKYLQYSSKKEFRGEHGTYYEENRDIITGKQNYKRKVQKIREEYEIKWKTQNIKKL